jgi:hypothetical protein
MRARGTLACILLGVVAACQRAGGDGGPDDPGTDRGTLDPDRFSLRFRDGEGNTAVVPGTAHVGATGIGPRFSDVVVPVADIEAAGVDLAQLETLELVFGGAGSLLVDDLRFE